MKRQKRRDEKKKRKKKERGGGERRGERRGRTFPEEVTPIKTQRYTMIQAATLHPQMGQWVEPGTEIDSLIFKTSLSQNSWGPPNDSSQGRTILALMLGF